jgi:hypothetical protein
MRSPRRPTHEKPKAGGIRAQMGPELPERIAMAQSPVTRYPRRMPRPDPIAELLLAGASPADLREAAAHYRRLAELPENAAIREEILRVAARFEDLAEERGNDQHVKPGSHRVSAR